MKQAIAIYFLFIIVFTSNAQGKKNSLQGIILDANNSFLSGASVIIVGTNYGVNTNEAGEYLFDQVPAGTLKVQVSYVGFETNVTDFDIQPGQSRLHGPRRCRRPRYPAFAAGACPGP